MISKYKDIITIISYKNEDNVYMIILILFFPESRGGFSQSK